MGKVNYLFDFVFEWFGNNLCEGFWLGVSCNLDFEVIVINLFKWYFNGIFSFFIVRLDSLRDIRLVGNNLNG